MTTRKDINIDRVIRGLLNGETFNTIAERESQLTGFNISRSLIAGVQRDLKNGRLAPTRLAPLVEAKSYIYGVDTPNGGVPLFTGHPQVSGNRVVISDTHIPKTNLPLFETVNKAGAYYGVKHLTIAGDWFDNGHQNNFRKKVTGTTMAYDLSMSRKLISHLLEWYDTIELIPGNHDDWFLENQDGQIGMQEYAALAVDAADIDRVSFYSYDRMTLYSAGVEWTIAHQSDTSVISLKVAEQLANKFHSNMIVPHQHNTALGYDRYAWYVLADIGGLHDASKMDYMSLKTGVRPVFDPGYAVIVDGAIELIIPDERLINWRRLNDV